MQAKGHKSYTATILLPPEGYTIRAFLSLEVVSYTWTVTEVKVTETYKFTVEATFATQVPAPVVIVDPIDVNLNELEVVVQELGNYSFSYDITNKGAVTMMKVFTSFLIHCKLFRFD